MTSAWLQSGYSWYYADDDNPSKPRLRCLIVLTDSNFLGRSGIEFGMRIALFQASFNSMQTRDRSSSSPARVERKMHEMRWPFQQPESEERSKYQHPGALGRHWHLSVWASWCLCPYYRLLSRCTLLRIGNLHIGLILPRNALLRTTTITFGATSHLLMRNTGATCQYINFVKVSLPDHTNPVIPCFKEPYGIHRFEKAPKALTMDNMSHPLEQRSMKS